MKNLKAAIMGIIACGSLNLNAQWYTTGNNIGSLDWLGGNSSSSNPLIFKTNGLERMRLAGNAAQLGIGVTAPSQALDVIGNISLRGTHLVFYSNPGVIDWGNGGGTDNLYFRRLSTMGNVSAFNTYMTIQGTGNVGIGTISPAQKLHVDNGAVFVTGTNPLGGPMLMLGGGTAGDPNGQWGIEYNTTAQGLNFWRPYPATNSGNYFLFLNNNGNVGVGTNNTPAKFNVNGKVLIGDPSVININTTNAYKLYVQDGILTEKVKIAFHTNAVTWADYVFDEDYKLMQLGELETFIANKGHLPNIPSAAEVQKEGLDVAAMDARLLEKIEELTLYTLQLNRKVAELEKELENLKSKR